MCKSEKCQRHILEGVGTNKAKFLSFLTIGSTDTILRSHLKGVEIVKDTWGNGKGRIRLRPRNTAILVAVGSTAPDKIFPAADTNS